MVESCQHADLVDGLPREKIPSHVAIIMDGNGRWARQRHLSTLRGHRTGVEAARRTVDACRYYGVKTLTLFAFSSENWQRPRAEVKHLMTLLLLTLRRETKRLKEHHIGLRVLGDLSAFSPEIRGAIEEAEYETNQDFDFTLQIAANYGGRWDIVQALQRLAKRVQQGELSPAEITEQVVTQALVSSDIHEPDLLIRTSGEQRISNFMLWQCAYTEFYFPQVLWPDFDREDFHRAMVAYVERVRRFGK